MKKLELLFGISFLAVIMAFIIPEIQSTIIAEGYTSGAGLILNHYGLIIIVVIVLVVVMALVMEGRD